MKLRVKFKKYGAVRFIGHLDMMRFFQKAIRRAQIDIAYTGGYSPHQIMTFAAPLGVGLTSNGEYMDIEVNSMLSCEDIMQRLNAVSVPGIEIVSVSVLPENAGNAMASVAAASYSVRFRDGRSPFASTDTVPALLEHFMARESIPIIKTTKKGTRELDLKPGIFTLLWKDDAFYMLVDASSAGNIKPTQVIEAFVEDCQLSLPENALLITREDVFTNIGTPETPQLLPLSAVGSDFLPDENPSDQNPSKEESHS